MNSFSAVLCDLLNAHKPNFEILSFPMYNIHMYSSRVLSTISILILAHTPSLGHHPTEGGCAGGD